MAHGYLSDEALQAFGTTMNGKRSKMLAMPAEPRIGRYNVPIADGKARAKGKVHKPFAQALVTRTATTVLADRISKDGGRTYYSVKQRSKAGKAKTANQSRQSRDADIMAAIGSIHIGANT